MAGEGIDTVHASIPTYTLAEPLEVLYLEPGATSGVGNSADNTLVGNGVANYLLGEAGNDTLNGRLGADVLVGGAGVDTFLFNRGEANGDTVTDFAGDTIGFIGYGQASFVRLDDTHWQVTSQDGATHETITFANAANILASDYHFLS